MQRYRKILIYARIFVTLQRNFGIWAINYYKLKYFNTMKKIFFMAFMVLSVSAMAQHVTPISFQIADVKLDSLRTLYISEPTMYRASLEVVAQNLAKNAEDLKSAKAELKTEQAPAKEIGNSLKGATKMAAALKKLYAKEESELKSMQKVVEKQQKTLNKQTELNQASRENYLQFLEKQQKELGYSLREVADRQRAITDLETAIQNGQTGLQTYIQETQQKAMDLAQMEAQYKERLAILKAEQKTAKTLQ